MLLAPVTPQIIGRQLKNPVYTEQGSLLIPQGALLNTELLMRLKNHNIEEVSLLETFFGEETAGLEVLGVPDETYQTAVRCVKDVFDEVLQSETLGIKAVIPPDQVALVHEVADALLSLLQENPDLLFAVVDLIEADAYTHRHNVNVAVLSMLTARAMGYRLEHVRDIALGALLHDIGKALVPPEVLQKPGQLSVEEKLSVMSHPELGYQILAECKAISYLTKQIILLHHEKLDGSGYPLGLKSIEIPEYVQIVTVCDMYDAMTTNRIYRQKMPAYQAIDILLAECVYKINPKILTHMLRSVVLYPPGTGVMLSDGRMGVVSVYKAVNPSRPRVRILNFDGDFVPTHIEEVNLEEAASIFIEDVWDVALMRDSLKTNRMSMQTTIEKRTV